MPVYTPNSFERGSILIKVQKGQINRLLAARDYIKAISQLQLASQIVINLQELNLHENFRELLKKELLTFNLQLARCYLQANDPISAYVTLCKLQAIIPQAVEGLLQICLKSLAQLAEQILKKIQDNLNKNNAFKMQQELEAAQEILLAIDELDSHKIYAELKVKIDNLIWPQIKEQFVEDLTDLLNDENNTSKEYLNELQRSLRIYDKYEKSVELSAEELKLKDKLCAKLQLVQEELNNIENLARHIEFKTYIKNLKQYIESNNIPEATACTLAALETFKTINPQKLTRRIKTNFGFNPEDSNVKCHELILRDLTSSHYITGLALEEYNQRSNGQEPQKLAQEILDKTLRHVDVLHGPNCLYQPHYALLLENLTNNLREYWFKFENKNNKLKASNILKFTSVISNLIQENLKAIGWIKWSEDLFNWRTYSIKSVITPYGEKVLPLIKLLSDAFKNYNPKIKASEKLELPILQRKQDSPQFRPKIQIA